MTAIDQAMIALGGYIVFSVFFSYILSYLPSKSHTPQKAQPSNENPPIEEHKKSKKEKIIKPGFEAFCNVCERSFENDTYLKNHLEGSKHIKWAANYQGEVYKIVKIQQKKK